MGNLIENHKQSLYNGVNQQSAEHRLETQVEECVNAVPTVNRGLVKRNPTEVRTLDNSITYQEDMFTYEYDRGLSGDNEEKYSVHIHDNGLEIVNAVSGKVYKEGSGLSYEGNAKEYLYPFNGMVGYSAITVKDTTFLSNRSAIPKLDNFTIGDTEDGETNDMSVYTATINLKTPSNFIYGIKRTDYSPTNLYYSGCAGLSVVGSSFGAGSTTSIIVDGITVTMNPFLHDKYTWIATTRHQWDVPIGTSTKKYPTYTYNNWKNDLVKKLTDTLPSKYYEIYTSGDGLDINIKRTDGNTVAVAFSISMRTLHTGGSCSDNHLIQSSSESDYYNGISYSDKIETVYTPPSTFKKQGFVWVKSSNPSSAYTYYVTVKDSVGNTYSTSTTKTTTDGAATALASNINSNANFSATAVGSVIEIIAVSGDMKSCDATDSYGSQASFGWAKAVQSSSDIPKNLGFEGSLVQVTGSRGNADTSYWLIYKGGKWTESMSNDTQPNLLPDTMPHVLVSNADDTFTIKPYDGWANKKVGDDITNPTPSFIQSEKHTSPAIKDMFFLKNRLGFITETTVTMSEVGEYGNFFRTTVATLLDSDRIDTTVDTTKAIQLEYATYLEDSLMLFSDKAQFKLEGGKILSPNSVQISQTSAYEINKNVRPLFMNDKVFFCAKRGNYTAVMQYYVDGNGRVSEAEDISSHIESYIPDEVTRISGSSINNMLFLSNSINKDTIYVYKFLDSGKDRIQSAWFKWVYNGDIYGAFSLGKNLNILINRKQSSIVTDWVLGSGIWEGDKLWTSDGIWYGSPDELTSVNNFEVQAIHPQNHDGYFVDASELVEDTDSMDYIVSTATSSSASLGCSQRITEDITITANTTSTNYSLEVTTNIGTYNAVSDSIVLVRNPSETITDISYTENDGVDKWLNGFSAILSNGTSSVLFNGDFTFGLNNWSFTDWDIVYKTKDIGALIPVDVQLGEWVLKKGDKSLTRGHLAFKTAQINSEEGSSFYLEVEDIKRGKTRNIQSQYTVNRKPMIYGNSKNIRLSIKNLDSKGFRINSVSFEGNYNKRSTRI